MSINYLLTRLFWALPTLFGVAVLVFVLVRVVPGDPIAMMLPPGATAEDVGRLRALYGLDGAIAKQFVVWMGDVLHGNFGTSISLHDGVIPLVLSRLPATLELVIVAVVAACAFATAAAVGAVYFRGRWPELVVDGAAGLVLAIPDFLWGLLFVLVLGVLFPMLPISGRINPTLEFDPATGFYLAEALGRRSWTALADLAARIRR